MVRLAISVEGQTEERFINQVLAPYLLTRTIYATPILINGHGGDVSISSAVKDLNKLARNFDKVTTLYDFYGFKGKEYDETKDSLEAKILEATSTGIRHKIMPYIQMYEFEGLLFTSPAALKQSLSGNDIENWGVQILSDFDDNPEQINNSQQTAPSKRLAQHTNYIKTVHGPTICADIGLPAIRGACLGFDAWMTSLEALEQPI